MICANVLRASLTSYVSGYSDVAFERPLPDTARGDDTLIQFPGLEYIQRENTGLQPMKPMAKHFC
jgi:hypothetical protein